MKVKTVIETLCSCSVRLIRSGSPLEYGVQVLAGPCGRLADECKEYYNYNVEVMTVSVDCVDCLDMYISPA